jgi:secondary thiamine-phosphate synthase enzyme
VVKTKHLKLSSKGRDDVLEITGEVADFVAGSSVRNGLATVFVTGSTASVTTIEYEPGLVKDIKQIDEKLIPSNVAYAHDETWGDANGYAHLRAAIIGPSLTIPVEEGKLTLGTWQQIIVIDHDNRPRTREIIVQIMGE